MKCIIKTKPVAKARPRFVNRGKYVQTYTPQKTLDFEKEIKKEFKKQCKNEYNPDYVGAIIVKLNICFQIPKSYSKKKKASLVGKPHTSKPDADNIAKSILDALNGIAWKDDSQVFFLNILKQYAEEDMIQIDIEYIEKE